MHGRIGVGDWVEDGFESGIVTSADYYEVRGEDGFTIAEPDNGRRAVVVYRSEIRKISRSS